MGLRRILYFKDFGWFREGAPIGAATVFANIGYHQKRIPIQVVM